MAYSSLGRAPVGGRALCQKPQYWPALDVVDVNHVVDVVVLEHDFLVRDQRLGAGRIQRVERHPPMAVRIAIAVGQRVPVKAQFDLRPFAAQYLNVGKVVLIRIAVRKVRYLLVAGIICEKIRSISVLLWRANRPGILIPTIIMAISKKVLARCK